MALFTVSSAPVLASVADSRDNNFNLLRLIAAVCVLISHAFPIAFGPGAEEPLARYLHGVTLGSVSILVFFAISGFLIARSFDRSTSLKRFFLARFLRIMPALFVVLAVTVVVAGMFFTDRSIDAFAVDATIYVLRNLSLYFFQYPLPGVFEENPYGATINGSLWTLNHEVSCYLGVVALGLIGALRNRRLMTLALASFVLVYVVVQVTEPHVRLVGLTVLGLPFAVGVAFYVWRDVVPLSLPIGIAVAAAAVVAHPTTLFDEALSIAIAYWVMLAAYLPAGWIRRFNTLGDYSYGVYLYAYPIQQLLVAVYGPMTAYENIAMALPATLFCAVLSWTFVEKPALSITRAGARAYAVPLGR